MDQETKNEDHTISDADTRERTETPAGDGGEKPRDDTRQKKLYRSNKDRIIGGVAGGIAEYYDIPSVWVRIGFILLAFVDAIGLLAYLLAWFLLPERVSEHTGSPGANLKKFAHEIPKAVQDAVSKFSLHSKENILYVVGLLMIAYIIMRTVTPGYHAGNLILLAAIVAAVVWYMSKRD